MGIKKRTRRGPPCGELMAVASNLESGPGRLVFSSSDPGDVQAKKSFLACSPAHVLKGSISKEGALAMKVDGQYLQGVKPLDVLETRLTAFSKKCVRPMPVAFGVLSYDFGQWNAGIPLAKKSNHAFWFGFYPWCLEHDASTDHWKAHGIDQADIDVAERVMRTSRRSIHSPRFGELALLPKSRDVYRQGFAKTKDYIGAGDCYQANISLPLHAPLIGSGDSLGVFGALKRHAPSSYSALLDMDDISLISASPERLFKYDAQTRRIETRPIKGTRALTGNAQLDQKNILELRQDPKEHAEHLMIVDLERNDVGMVAEIGSVDVTEYAKPREFKSVVHLVSTIEATVRQGVGTADIIRAMFPGGSITGAPKKRSMEVIAECEGQNRGMYCGSAMVFYSDGSMDASILIRSAELSANGLALRMGGGIVADSIFERELLETEEKSKGWRDLLATL